MMHKSLSFCVVVLLLGIASGSLGAAGQDPAVVDGDVTLVSFVDLDYPLVARTIRIQGVVVVAVTLGDDGSVITATTLSGPQGLVADVLDNVKKWRFKATRQKRAVLVYEFHIDPGACHERGRSLFLLRHWNFASIVACESVVEG